MGAYGGVGGSDAAREDSVGGAGNRRIGGWCACHRKNPAGAILDDDELHDELQFAGGGVPVRLCCPGYAADWRGDGDQQRQCEHVLFAQLLDAAGFLSDDLRPGIAGTVVLPSQPRSAIDSVIESTAFSVAD
jgi:hypothetical protein